MIARLNNRHDAKFTSGVPSLRLPEGRASVYPSVCLSRRSIAATACGWFAAERPAGRRYRQLSSNGAAARRSAATAGSVMLTADVGGEHELVYFFVRRFCIFINASSLPLAFNSASCFSESLYAVRSSAAPSRSWHWATSHFCSAVRHSIRGPPTLLRRDDLDRRRPPGPRSSRS